MFVMMMQNLVKVNVAKQLVRETRSLTSWETITLNFYYLQHKNFHIYIKDISQKIIGNLS